MESSCLLVHKKRHIAPNEAICPMNSTVGKSVGIYKCRRSYKARMYAVYRSFRRYDGNKVFNVIRTADYSQA